MAFADGNGFWRVLPNKGRGEVRQNVKQKSAVMDMHHILMVGIKVAWWWLMRPPNIVGYYYIVLSYLL